MLPFGSAPGADPQGAYILVSADGKLPQSRTLAGTANQVIATDGGAGGAITLSTPQNIHTGASPTFAGLTLSGLTAGSLVFTGTSGLLSVDNPKLRWDDTNFRLLLSQNPANITPIGAFIEAHGPDGAQAISYLVTYGDIVGGSTYVMVHARGTASSPTKILLNNNMGAFAWAGYNGSAFSSNRASIKGSAAEDWSLTANGTYFNFFTTAIGTLTTAEVMRITDVGVIKINGTALRGTTEGVGHLDIFNGTDPVGTLVNGISLFSSSGKLKLADAAGNIGHILAAQSVNVVSPTAQNRTLTVDINGTTYYITAKTTND